MTEHVEGMTLLDWFAGQALMGLLAKGGIEGRYSNIAEVCYIMAQHMMTAKGRAEAEADH